MKWIVFSCALALAAGAAPLRAADVRGTWSGMVRIPGGGELPLVAHLRQEGTAVTGRLGGINGAPNVDIFDGRIEGGVVRFSGVRQVQGTPIQFNYRGTVAGETIAFTITRQDGQGPPLESVARRAK